MNNNENISKFILITNLPSVDVYCLYIHENFTKKIIQTLQYAYKAVTHIHVPYRTPLHIYW